MNATHTIKTVIDEKEYTHDYLRLYLNISNPEATFAFAEMKEKGFSGKEYLRLLLRERMEKADRKRKK